MGNNIMPAIRILEDGEPLPVGSKQIPYHIAFDMKMDFKWKARNVAGDTLLIHNHQRLM
jgi:hypothetical protein